MSEITKGTRKIRIAKTGDITDEELARTFGDEETEAIVVHEPTGLGDAVRYGEIRMPPEKPKASPVAPRQNLPGRNQSCPCGSGIKYKKCCMRQSS